MNFIFIVQPAIQGDSIENKEVIFNQMADISCSVSGNPLPTVVWYKDGKELFIDNFNVFTENDNQKLIILKPDEADSAIYSCVATSTVGHARKDTNLTVLSKTVLLLYFSDFYIAVTTAYMFKICVRVCTWVTFYACIAFGIICLSDFEITHQIWL